MSSPTLRTIELLRMIPREPRRVSTSELRDRLAAQGYEITPRTIQRDLMKLSDSFPLVCDERAPPYGWSWSKNAYAQSLPGMDVPTALTFSMAEQYLYEMLPKGALKLLNPHFKEARQVLKASGNGMLAWRDKIRILPRYQPLHSPQVNASVITTLYDALFRDQRVSVRYRPRSDEPRDYELSPQGLAFRDAVIYLVATQKEYDNVVMFALHRFTRASLLDKSAHHPPGFDFDEWIRKGGFDALDNPKSIQLHARFHPSTAEHLRETPLSENQTITEESDGWVRIRAEVLNTQQLLWWLRGFGDGVEVIKPVSLRNQLAANAKAMAKMYR